MAVTEARDAGKGEIYTRTKNRFPLPTYYEVPAISREAYEKRLRRKHEKHSLLCGADATNLRRLTEDPDAVLLRRVVRWRTAATGRYSELATLVVVDPGLRLRAVKQKPTRKE